MTTFMGKSPSHLWCPWFRIFLRECKTHLENKVQIKTILIKLLDHSNWIKNSVGKWTSSLEAKECHLNLQPCQPTLPNSHNNLPWLQRWKLLDRIIMWSKRYIIICTFGYLFKKIRILSDFVNVRLSAFIFNLRLKKQVIKTFYEMS